MFLDLQYWNSNIWTYYLPMGSTKFKPYNAANTRPNRKQLSEISFARIYFFNSEYLSAFTKSKTMDHLLSSNLERLLIILATDIKELNKGFLLQKFSDTNFNELGVSRYFELVLIYLTKVRCLIIDCLVNVALSCLSSKFLKISPNFYNIFFFKAKCYREFLFFFSGLPLLRKPQEEFMSKVFLLIIIIILNIILLFLYVE